MLIDVESDLLSLDDVESDSLSLVEPLNDVDVPFGIRFTCTD